MESLSGGSCGLWHTRAMRRSKSCRRLLLGGGSKRQLTCRASVATSWSCSRPGEGEDRQMCCLGVGGNISGERLTQDVDKDVVQVEGEQRIFKPLEVVPHCPQDVPLKAGVQLLLAVAAIRP